MYHYPSIFCSENEASFSNSVYLEATTIDSIGTEL